MPTKTIETTLKRLETSKILKSTKHGSRKNSKTTWILRENQIFPGSEENIWKYFNRILTKYEKKVLRYEKKLQKYRDRLYEEEKTDFVVWLVKAIWFIDWRFYYAKKLYPDVDLEPEMKRFDELKKRIFNLAVNSTEYSLKIVDNVNRELNSDAANSEETFDEEFRNIEI